MSDFEDKVSEVVSKMEPQDDGTWVIPEDVAKDLDEATLYAVNSERRFRDTQGAYTRSQQEVKKHQAINKGLTDHMIKNITTHITDAQRQELDVLKVENPEEWRTKLDQYEEESKTTLKDALKTIETEGSNKSEVDIRAEKMAAWSKSTGIELTDDIVDSELPPRYKKDLEEGKITFDQFLTRASDFLEKEKVILGANEEEEEEEPNLNKLPGSNAPSERAAQGDLTETYEKVVY